MTSSVGSRVNYIRKAQKELKNKRRETSAMDTQSRISKAKPLVAGAQDALYNMKYEIASEMAINVPHGTSWGNVTSRDCGRVGGNMTKKLVQMGQQQLSK
jgi:hypothetical protein